MCEPLKIRLPAAPAAVRVEGEGPSGPEPAEGADPSAHGEAAFREGYDAAAEEWKARFGEALRRLDEEAKRLESYRARYWESLERNAVELGLAVAEKFLISERERKRYAVPAMVRSLMEGLGEARGGVTVVLNPGDLETLGGKDPLEEMEGTEGKPVVKLEADPSVPPAGCRIETRWGSVSMSLEQQMEELRKMLTHMEVPEDEGRAGD